MRSWIQISLSLVAAMLWWNLAASNAAEQKVYESRAEIPLEYRWNLEDILPTKARFDEAVGQVEAAIPKIQSYAGRLGESPDTLAEALALRFEIDPTMEDVLVYASQWRRQDTRNAEAKEYEARAQPARQVQRSDVVLRPGDRPDSGREDR